jgi:farnesyl diphosphate synthase
MVHAYSLVHDDLPCMDDDVLRRGKPTVHVEFDEATAMLVGDALQAQAFLLLSDQKLADDPAVQLAMVKTLAAAAGSGGMAGGQAIDLESTGKPLSQTELEFMHVRKTGALISAAVKMGALCAGACPPALEQYAHRVGLAFQVVDDVLDAEASTATLGKTAGKDSKHGKPTYVSAMGAARAKAFAGELRAGAQEALAPFGERAVRLRQLADFIVFRKF